MSNAVIKKTPRPKGSSDYNLHFARFYNCTETDTEECIKIIRAGKPTRRRITRETIQDREISGLRYELATLRSAVKALLEVADANDIQAAKRLKLITPSNADLLEMAANSGPPPGLADEPDDRPEAN